MSSSAGIPKTFIIPRSCSSRPSFFPAGLKSRQYSMPYAVILRWNDRTQWASFSALPLSCRTSSQTPRRFIRWRPVRYWRGTEKFPPPSGYFAAKPQPTKTGALDVGAFTNNEIKYSGKNVAGFLDPEQRLHQTPARSSRDLRTFSASKISFAIASAARLCFL